MSTIVFDPDDPSVAIIANASVGDFGVAAGASVIANVHPASRCAGRPCVMHAPSDHHMRGWALNWRDDTGVMERLCPHGVGHPDPDAVAYASSIGQDWQGVHGCDGCCREVGRE